MVTIPRSFERLETVAHFLTLYHSPYTISRFTSYLKLLLLPEVKYLECLLPACLLASLTMTRVVPPLSVVLADDVSQKVWLNLILT